MPNLVFMSFMFFMVRSRIIPGRNLLLLGFDHVEVNAVVCCPLIVK